MYYKNMEIWKKSIDLVEEVYSITKYLPKEEKYAITDQMKRAAISIPSNFAEGQGRNTTKDYLQFLSIARGSVYELDTQLEICLRLKYFTKEQIHNTCTLCNEINRMINSIITKLRNK